MLNKELELLSIWFKANKLSLNTNKTKFMVFNFGKKAHSATQFHSNVIINNSIIEQVTVTKFLGVLIDENFSWDYHIQSIHQKISKNVSVLYRSKRLLDSHSLYILYCSLILPYINYACEIWGNACAYKVNSIFLLQKKPLELLVILHIETIRVLFFLSSVVSKFMIWLATKFFVSCTKLKIICYLFISRNILLKSIVFIIIIPGVAKRIIIL